MSRKRARCEWERVVADDSNTDERPTPDKPWASLRDVEGEHLAFLKDEGLEFLAACRAIGDPAVRRAIMALLRALAGP